MAKEVFNLPDGSVTGDAGFAAEQWANAFYEAKDVVGGLRDAFVSSIRGEPVRTADELIHSCEQILDMGA